MNKITNAIILDYISQANTDFALQIDGEWGCGKTYYIQNELRKKIAEKEYKIIYVSLNGLIDVVDIDTKIFYRYVKINATKNKEIPVASKIENIWDEIFPDLEKSGIFGIAGTIAKSAMKAVNKSFNLAKYVIILDDLERVSKNVEISALLGHIYDVYTSKGVKTLFVSYENEIKDENFKKYKEKVIRRTLSYNPDFKLQFDEFVRNCYPEHAEEIRKHKDFFVSKILKKEIKNLRTISFILDNFFYTINKIRSSLKQHSYELVFVNLLLLTDEFKKGNISQQDLGNYKDLQDIGRAYYFKTEKGEDTYASKFYAKYNSHSGLEYVFIQPLFDYVVTGYLDVNSLNDSLDLIINRVSPEELERRKLDDFLAKEQSEVIEIKNTVIEYMNNGKYSLLELPKIYRTLKYIQDKKYLPNFDDDLKPLFEKAFSISASKSENVPNSQLSYYGLADSDLKDDNFYQIFIQKIKNEINSRHKNSNCELIKSIFEFANKGASFIPDYEYGKLFSDIVEFNQEELFLSLNNSGIYYFHYLLSKDIINNFTAGKTDEKSKDALNKIIEYIKANIDNKGFDNMRLRRFEDLIDVMQDCIKHLQNTSR